MYSIHTIGHSHHTMEQLLALLAPHAMDTVVDVRSAPYSRHVPRFNKVQLSQALTGHGLTYLFMGDLIGGKPGDPALHDERGRVCYERIAQSAGFRQGISRLLLGLARGHRIVLLCAEEDPTHCHRHRLIARHLHQQGVTVLHLRGDGSILPAANLLDDPQQLSLF